jgi:tRNA-dihydrouridine synthase
MSKVPAHFELILEIVQLRDEISPETQLVINGDIKDLRQCRELAAQYPGVDGYMIGRGVLENPYCFTEHEPTVEELFGLFRLHLDLFDAQDMKRLAETSEKMREDPAFALKMDGKVRGLPFEPLKHYFKIYVAGFPGAAELRARLMECKTTEEVRVVLTEAGY